MKISLRIRHRNATIRSAVNRPRPGERSLITSGSCSRLQPEPVTSQTCPFSAVSNGRRTIKHASFGLSLGDSCFAQLERDLVSLETIRRVTVNGRLFAQKGTEHPTASSDRELSRSSAQNFSPMNCAVYRPAHRNRTIGGNAVPWNGELSLSLSLSLSSKLGPHSGYPQNPRAERHR